MRNITSSSLARNLYSFGLLVKLFGIVAVLTISVMYMFIGELGEYGNNVTEGMMFRNREAFKQHMAIYAISMKFQYRSRKSEPGLMVLECCGLNCPWRVYAVKLKDADVFEVRKVVSEHTCSIDERGGYQTQATSSVIGELMRNKFGSAGGGPRCRQDAAPGCVDGTSGWSCCSGLEERQTRLSADNRALCLRGHCR